MYLCLKKLPTELHHTRNALERARGINAVGIESISLLTQTLACILDEDDSVWVSCGAQPLSGTLIRQHTQLKDVGFIYRHLRFVLWWFVE